MKFFLLLFLALFTFLANADYVPYYRRGKRQFLNPNDKVSVVTNNGSVIRTIKRSKEVFIPEATSNTVTTIITNDQGRVVNAYLTKVSASNRKGTKSMLLGGTTNYVAYVKPINYFKYKKENIVSYVESTNDVNEVLLSTKNKSKLLKADGSDEEESREDRIYKRIEILEAQVATNKVLLAEATQKGDQEEIDRLTKLINRQEKQIQRLYHILLGHQDGGFYLMSDDTYVTYRTALNYGFAGDPTNDIMRACYNSVTNDPWSLWSVRKKYTEDPTHDARTTTSENHQYNPRRIRPSRK